MIQIMLESAQVDINFLIQKIKKDITHFMH